MVISKGKVVSIHYTLKNGSGEVLDSSSGGEPLAYLHGVGNLIPGLEQALDGHEVGERLDVSVAPEDGYGARHDELVQEVPRSAFGDVEGLEPGMRFRAQGPQGEQVVTVTAVSEEQVTVDGNHPLAGETLEFAVEISEVRDATAEETEHGHVHGPEGHEHGPEGHEHA